MKFYSLAKKFLGLKSQRVKLFSLACAHTLGMRYLGIFLDPVMACNIRCKMCYFSDDSARPTPLKPMSEEMIEKLEDKLFKHAIKLQLGCAAEPTLYKGLAKIIERAKKSKIPYVEITTNGQLVDYDYLKKLVNAGLDGMTLSLHGIKPSTYELFMDRARFDKLLVTIDAVVKIQKEKPDFTFRVNYTFNNDNIEELKDISSLFKNVKIDVLQIRPIQDIGSKNYVDFDMGRIIDRFDSLITPVLEQCKSRGVTFIGPTRENLMEVNKEQNPLDGLIVDMTYCYVSSESCYRDFDLEHDTLRTYHRRKKTLSKIAKKILSAHKGQTVKADSTKKINYKIS